MRLLLRAGLACCAALLLSQARAAISVLDDENHSVILVRPAHRIVSLAPHATELLYAAGAGPYMVGVSEYSDFPPQAQKLTSVGGVSSLDLERVIALKPELVIAWGSGNSAAQVARLRDLGIPVFISEPRNFATIASSIERLGRLAGTEKVAQDAATAFRMRLNKLQQTYRHRPPVKVFYQIWRAPLMTLNNAHLVSSVIRLCGGQNIFGGLPQLAPTVSLEGVLQANPETIFITDASDDAFEEWRRFPKLTAAARGNLFRLDGNLMNRAGPRILDGAEALCKDLDVARSKR
nr:cobalamin-binding protein [Noviherbaspirillum massiliense]